MQKEILEKKESELEEFRKEMQRKKKEELAGDPHWKGINVGKLAEEDRIIYRKYQEKMPLQQLLKDFKEYREKISWENKSRANFHMWLANKLQIRLASKN